MIKRIKIENCLSFDKFEINLDKMNILIGKNNSGKSNFCHILQFIRLTPEVDSIGEAFARAMHPNARFFNFNSEKSVAKFELECELPSNKKKSEKFHYLYSLSLRTNRKNNAFSSLEVLQETLQVLSPVEKTLIKNTHGKVMLLREKEGKHISEQISPTKTMLRETAGSNEYE